MRVAVLELRALDARPLHLDAVRRVEVDDPVRRALLPDLGVPPRDVRVGELDVAVLRAADHDAARLVSSCALPSTSSDATSRSTPSSTASAASVALRRRLRLVDHRRARLGLAGRLVLLAPGGRSGCTIRVAIPNSPIVEVVVGLEQHARRRQQHVALAPRVLGQVLRPARRGATPRSPRTARGRRARGRPCTRSARRRARRRRAVVVHLLDELARQLDRLDVRPERAAEDPLEEAFDLLLDAAEDAHAAEGFPRRPSLIAPRVRASPSRCGFARAGSRARQLDPEAPRRAQRAADGASAAAGRGERP